MPNMERIAPGPPVSPPPPRAAPVSVNGNGSPLRWLNQLGRLSAGFDGQKLLPLLEHSNDKVRQLAVVNLGKLGDVNYLRPLQSLACGDPNTMVRREAASAIGRMRSRRAIPALVRITKDADPKVAMQALRGLLVFERNGKIHAALQDLESHPNELIREAIERERVYDFESEADRAAHTESPDEMKNLTVHGDTLNVLKKTPAESIHLTFTSPPYYNARDYSIYPSYKAYLGFLEKVFRQVHRVTKPGRFLVLNTSPVIIPRLGRQHSSKRYAIPFDIHPHLLRMGWEFIDDIVWVKPEASVKNRNGGFFQHRKPLAYKPNARTEYLMVYRKKSTRLIDWNIRQYGADAIRQSRVEDGYETSNVWELDPKWDRGHTAVFPASLCDRVVRYYSFAGDLVFDPFGGSGTLGKAAARLSRHFMMTEISDEYIERIRDNLREMAKLFDPPSRFLGEAEYALQWRRAKCR